MGGKSKAQTIGYKYYLGMQSALCHGPIDRITRATVDDRIAWQGISTGGSININAESLFGGESREGGVSGTIDVMMGGPTQGVNSYLVAKCDPDVPAYRGVVNIVFRQCYMGNNPYLKPWRFRGQRIHTRQNGISQWYDTKAEIPSISDMRFAAFYLVWEMRPSGGGVSITPNANQSIVFSTGDGLTYNVPLLVRGLVEYRSYPGSTVVSGSIVKGGTPGTPAVANEYKMEISNPPAVYYFNAGSFGAGELHEINAAITVPVHDGATVTLSANTGSDSAMSGTYQYVSLSVDGDSLDLNPAHMIRECLTDPDWGMGYLDSDIDDASFTYAADKLYQEFLGMSLLWDKQILIDAFIQEIVKHIDAALYVSRTTGKFVLKLIRADYNPSDLITLDESNISRIEDPSRPTFGELTNSVTVNYWDAKTGKDASLTRTDTAMALVQGATINTPVQYPGFTCARNATIAGNRDLRSLSSPLLNCTVYVDSTAENLNVGDVFKLTWPKWNIYNLVMRITSFGLSNGKSNQIKLTCIQDVFDTNTTVPVTAPPPSWEDPSQPPQATVDSLAIEAPYLELVQSLGQANVDDALANKPDSGYVLGAAPRPTGGINARMWTDNGDGTGYNSIVSLEFCPYCELTAPVDKVQTLFSTTGGRDMDQVVIGQHGQIGDEIVRIDAVDTVANTVTVGRGCLDTVPQAHAPGTSFFLWDLDSANDPTEYVSGEVIDVKIQPVSGAGVVDLSLVSERTVVMDSRAWRPYAPGDLRINGESYEAHEYSEELTITWTHRNRLEQTGGTIVDHTMGDIGPEPGTLYRLQGYFDGVLSYTEDDISGTTTSWTPATFGATVTVEIHAKRDGVYSWQGPSHSFLYSNGDIRITEELDIRAYEDGDLHILEV